MPTHAYNSLAGICQLICGCRGTRVTAELIELPARLLQAAATCSPMPGAALHILVNTLQKLKAQAGAWLGDATCDWQL